MIGGMVADMAKTMLQYLVNRAPVDLRPRGGYSRSWLGESGPAVHDLEQMGNVSTVFSIVDGISSEVAAAQWHLYRGDTVDDPDRIEVTRHAALSVWGKPNPFQTTAEFVEASQQHYELTGEYWWVLGNGAASFPLELWGVRPDRIQPVPHPTEFIAGYLYEGTIGEPVPLAVDQVIWNKRPNPLTPYRGLSPLGSLLYDISGDSAAAQYNAMFFKNGADPGGIIQAEGPQLSDDDFDLLMQRWKESHKGVGNAHRVGYLENAKFIPTQYTRRDMQFVDLRTFSKETIREAWRFPRSMMGSEAASNRATHEAEKQVFADNLIKPRLRRLRSSLNDDFLPMFPGVGKASTRRLWFDFDDPSPDDRESQRADQDSAIAAVAALVPLGFDPADALEAFELPEIKFQKPEPTPPPRIEAPPSQDELFPPEEDTDEEPTT